MLNNDLLSYGYIRKQEKTLYVKVPIAIKQCVSSFNIKYIIIACGENINNQLGFNIVSDEEKFIDNTEKLSARSYATLVINKSLTLKQQEDLVVKMNKYIKEKREQYNSLFLTNYRESNTIARKRISFDLAFKICNYTLSSYTTQKRRL